MNFILILPQVAFVLIKVVAIVLSGRLIRINVRLFWLMFSAITLVLMGDIFGLILEVFSMSGHSFYNMQNYYIARGIFCMVVWAIFWILICVFICSVVKMLRHYHQGK